VLGGALARALVVYWLVVFPCARRELRHWLRCAEAIEDPALRRLALAKLSSEAIVAEGAAAFAVLAPAHHRASVVRAAVAYEVLYDAVDAIGELPAVDPLAHNRAVHAALLDALAPHACVHDHLAFAPMLHDGAYLLALIQRCRQALCRLPAHQAAIPALQRFAARAREAQSLNHAGDGDGRRALAAWAAAHGVQDARWWEVAAAASDPLGIFALVAAAADSRTGAREIETIERAYFPWIGALVWLMESLVDRCDDARSGNHSYVAHYRSPQEAAARFAVIARRAGAMAGALPDGPSHGVLLAGVASLYLSTPEATTADASAATCAIRDALGWPVGALAVVLRVRRRLGALRAPRLRRRPAARP
jgi:tetraprenyl-beta-curcumene synthase